MTAEQSVAKPQGTFARWTARVAALSKTPHALFFLVLVSIIDGSVFPVPPFALLIPMVLARRERALFYATVGTVASLFGGLIGYGLGYAIGHGLTSFLAIDPSLPLHFKISSWQVDTTLREVLTHNFWILAIACSILPTPYKVVAIGSGVVGVALPSFVLASILGRTVRFFVIAFAFAIFGATAAKYLGQKSAP